MKFTKILALLLALVCCFTALVACDGEDKEDEKGGLDETPDTAYEYFLYASDYMATHTHKMTTVTTSSTDGADDIVSETVNYVDGTNYYIPGDVETTFYDGVIYVSSSSGKRKMSFAGTDLGAALGDANDYVNSMAGSMSDDDFTMTKNDDGTIKLEFSISMAYVGTIDYVWILDNDYRLVSQTLRMTQSYAGYTISTVDVCTYEYSDQYKVTMPADADEYETVDDIYDLYG
jgi:hypothetical protein